MLAICLPLLATSEIDRYPELYTNLLAIGALLPVSRQCIHWLY